MWIMTNNGYLSIVSKDCGPAELLVRARRAGDIEKVFPNAKVTRRTDSDYLYRAILPRDVVKRALAAMIDLIDYPNFKDSVEDRSIHRFIKSSRLPGWPVPSKSRRASFCIHSLADGGGSLGQAFLISASSNSMSCHR
jgi:hypothetical protein